MMAHELLHFHPLTNTGTTTISRTDLVKFLTATGHPPRIEVLNGTEGEGA
jgi:Ala-tRNA(Pro) deacylase